MNVLYLGTDPVPFLRSHPEMNVIHYPIIQIVPRDPHHPPIASIYAKLSNYSHLLFTSKNGVHTFFTHLQILQILPPPQKEWIAIGKQTASCLEAKGVVPSLIAKEESQEGVIALLQAHPLPPSSHFLIPRSSLSRDVLHKFLINNEIQHTPFDIYDTQFHLPPFCPSFDTIDLFVFTSPSTVRAFVHFFGTLPPQEKRYSIGPITQIAIDSI